MSQANVEIVRAAMELYQHPEGVALLASGDLDFELIDPEIEWDASRLADMIPDLAEVYWGHEGVRTYWRRWFEAWKDLEFEVQDVREAGDEVVALIRNQRQWGRHTGICTELPPWAMVFTFRDATLVRWRTFPNHESALEAVGLEAQPMSQEPTPPPDLVELTRRMFEATNRRDLDVAQSFYAPDAVWEAVSLGTSFEGVAAIRGFFEDWLSAYEEYEMEPEEIVDLGNGVVFAVTRITARLVGSAGSGLKRRRPLVFIWVEGLVARVTAYADSIDEGRAAAERLAASRG